MVLGTRPPANKDGIRPLALADSDDVDEADRALRALGYNPVFKRRFTKWSAFSFALSISGIYGTLMTTLVYPLQAGGPASIIWSWLLGGAGGLALAISIAEVSSAYPTSGAMYFTMKYLAPAKHVAILSWITGWLNMVGTTAGTASTQYGAAQMLLAAISIGTRSAYEPTQGHVVGVMAALTIIHASINSLSTGWLNRLTRLYAGLHLAVLLSACVALLVLQKEKHPARYVFTHFESFSGWSPAGFAFLFGTLSPAWIMTNCDATAHIAEEAIDPSRVVPLAIAAGSITTYILGFLFNLVLVFCMGDPATLARTAHGQPVAQIFYDIMGPGPAVFFTIMGFIVLNFVCIPSIQAGSRTLWSFSRDEMVPFSKTLYTIDRRTDTPIIAVWTYAGLCILINLIGLASQIAIGAVFNVCAVALNLSYVVPIICKLVGGRFERGPWHLGVWSLPINIWACGWNMFMSVIFLLPIQLPVTPGNMNYAVAVLVLVLSFSVIYWFAAGRKFYTGPRTHAHIEHGQAVVDERPPGEEKTTALPAGEP
ncbi:Amino-acid permease 2 [Coniochaeta hoffmannii]|uniref:Amino-acid permease 2 n=1 Tax=Coniochaeta hoffmannii TaxID=91930 RepID=A0AA38RS17_9PEZI|nr:Amino-acid permease 2 [Coniochaeta hoffmannii]